MSNERNFATMSNIARHLGWKGVGNPLDYLRGKTSDLENLLNVKGTYRKGLFGIGGDKRDLWENINRINREANT